MLEAFQGAVFIERAYSLLKNDRIPNREKKQCALKAVRYLVDLRYTKSPYWKVLLDASGLHDTETIELVPAGNKKHLALCKAVAHEYSEAINLLETMPNAGNEYFQNLEIIAQLLILSNNLKGLEELDYRLNDSHGAAAIKEEVEAMRRTKLLICGGFYMQGKFLDFCRNFFKFEKNDPDFWSTMLAKVGDRFFTLEEILLMATISVIVSTPFDNYGDFLAVENLSKFREECPLLVDCLKLLSNTCFGRFLHLWDGNIDEQCCKSPFLLRGWKTARFMVRNKIYFFYLRISNRLTISYLSRTLSIDETLVEREVRQLLNDLHLNFEIRQGTITYHSAPFLTDVVGKLKTNSDIIHTLLESRSLTTKQLKDSLQEAIIGNSSDLRDRQGGLNSASTERAAFRQGFDEDMDVDEINDISDVETASYVSGGNDVS